MISHAEPDGLAEDDVTPCKKVMCACIMALMCSIVGQEGGRGTRGIASAGECRRDGSAPLVGPPTSDGSDGAGSDCGGGNLHGRG